MQISDKKPFWRKAGFLLICIMLLGAGLRLYNLRQSPPGFNQDEAANAWNAWCLLKTGKDQHGVSWPIFYARSLGGNSSTLFIYAIIPFQAIGGLNIVTSRLPGAVGGIITILLIYYVGRRLFNEATGLWAALLLTLNPWHLQQSRWGHEASIGALLGLIALAAMLWANMPITNDKADSPRPIRAFFAGTITGICCYGYHSLRIFVPVFLLAAGLVTIGGWWRQLKIRKGAIAIGAYILGIVLTFGPLAWQHLFHPDGISRHSEFQKSLIEGQPILTGLRDVGLRYIQHFGPDFLFIHGDTFEIQRLPGSGEFQWYMLPLMIAGLCFAFWKFRGSYAARVLLVFILVYPVGDCLYTAHGMHALRSSPGLCSLILLGAVGLVGSYKVLIKQSRLITAGVVITFIAALVISNAGYLHRFYVDYNRQPETYNAYHADLVEACKWLKPVFYNNDTAAAMWSCSDMPMAYVVTLVCLNYDPQQWLNDTKKFNTFDEYDYYTNYGKMYFMYSSGAVRAVLDSLPQFNLQGDAIFIVRPGELPLENPVHVIRNPVGQVTLEIYRLKPRM